MTAPFRQSVGIIIISLMAAAPAFAQRPVPDQGMGAITLSFGASMPADDVLDTGWFLGVAGDWYLTPRFSIKAQIGGAWHDVVNGALDGKVSPMHITGAGVYNWERGKFHPYAGGGIGWYRYRFGEGDDRPTDSKFGVNLGGGVEYFFTRTDVVQGDITFHLVPGDVESNFFVYKPRYWTLSAGYKKYF